MKKHNLLPPLWLRIPEFSQYSMGWRMGYGEDYAYCWRNWFDTLSEDERKQYKEDFPSPVFWNDFYDETPYDDDDFCETISIWQKKGLPKYSIETLPKGDIVKSRCVFFGGEDIDQMACFSPFQRHIFSAEDDFFCIEHYIEFQKALFFEDEIWEKIREETQLDNVKSLAQKIKNFDPKKWNKIEHTIILEAYYYKFATDDALREILFSTGDKILIATNPLDEKWSIGLDETDPNIQNPQYWKGKNRLGFALMEVRDELRRVYKNYDTINWEEI